MVTDCKLATPGDYQTEQTISSSATESTPSEDYNGVGRQMSISHILSGIYQGEYMISMTQHSRLRCYE